MRVILETLAVACAIVIIAGNLVVLAYSQQRLFRDLATAGRENAVWHARAEDDRRDLRHMIEALRHRAERDERRIEALEKVSGNKD